MEPLYESDHATVIHGDARDVLPTLGRESVDCVVTDPPYGQAYQSNQRGERHRALAGDGSPEEARALLDAVTPDLVRVLRRTRHLWTFGLMPAHKLLPERAQTDVVWNKERMTGGDLTSAWGRSHEPIYLSVRAADATNARNGAGSLAARLRRGSVITVPRAHSSKRHPTEKPVELVRQLVESSTTVGEVVLDPFAGSGSTGVAAVLEGRRCLLVEMDREYAEIAADRIKGAEAIALRALSA